MKITNLGYNPVNKTNQTHEKTNINFESVRVSAKAKKMLHSMRNGNICSLREHLSNAVFDHQRCIYIDKALSQSGRNESAMDLLERVFSCKNDRDILLTTETDKSKLDVPTEESQWNRAYNTLCAANGDELHKGIKLTDAEREGAGRAFIQFVENIITGAKDLSDETVEAVQNQVKGLIS